MPNHRSLLPAALALGAAAAAIALAGPLDPPSGPITPTYKTLTEVEPRIAVNATNTPGDFDNLCRITQPGSYYLTGNITGSSGKNGIRILVGGVTLDLMGFELAGGAGTLSGIVAPASVNNVAIVNGSVRGWVVDGVECFAVNSRLSGLRVSESGAHGILAGAAAVITDCTVTSSGGRGIDAGSGCSLTNCSTTFGTVGISTGSACTLTGCAAQYSALEGMLIGDGSTLTGCSSFDGGSTGIRTDRACTLTGCSATSNQAGIFSYGSTITACSSNGNVDFGFFIGLGSTIAGCSASQNSGDGIFTGYEESGCIVRDNICMHNGGAGISVNGSDNRIEGNNCTFGNRGIDVQVQGNIIIRNTCARNTTDWVIAANNVYGPIIDRRAPASAAVNGFAAASTLGSTDANANYSY